MTDPVITVTVEPGVDLRVLVDGPDDGPPVVLLHGFIGSARQWDANTDALTGRGWRVVRPDFRGHGESTGVGIEAAYTFEHLERDVVAVLDRLGLGTVHLVGHSMGGLVAQLVAIDHPARLRSLVLVDCSPLPGERSGPVRRRLLHLVGYRIGPARLVRALAPVLARLTAGQSRDRTRDERRAAIDDLVASLEQVDPAAFVSFGERLGSHGDLRPFLGCITVPTTVVAGEHEIDRLRSGADALEAGIADARRRDIAGAGHSPPMEQPERFDAVLAEHLGWATAGPDRAVQ